MEQNEEIMKVIKNLLEKNSKEDTHQLLLSLIDTDINKFFIIAEMWVEMHPKDDFIKNIISERLKNPK